MVSKSSSCFEAPPIGDLALGWKRKSPFLNDNGSLSKGSVGRCPPWLRLKLPFQFSSKWEGPWYHRPLGAKGSAPKWSVPPWTPWISLFSGLWLLSSDPFSDHKVSLRQRGHKWENLSERWVQGQQEFLQTTIKPSQAPLVIPK